MNNHKPYRLFIFDWEGTLGEDTVGQVLNAIVQEANRLHLGTFNTREARTCVSLGLTHAVAKLFPSLSLDQHEQLLQAVHLSLATGKADDYLMPGARALIQALHAKGLLIAIATNKGQASLQRVLHASGLEPYIQGYRCAGRVPAKPCTQMLIELLDMFQVAVKDAIMIGDSSVDIEMAYSMGMDSIGVDFYHATGDILMQSGAQAVFDDYQKVAKFLGISI